MPKALPGLNQNAIHQEEGAQGSPRSGGMGEERTGYEGYSQLGMV